jgi:hypothetical protein
MNKTESNGSYRRPILVTGAHRTGTTWVGKMLAANDQTAYISEPLNVLHRPGVMRLPLTRWYTYICSENELDFLTAIQEMLHFRYHLGAELMSLRSRKDLLRMGRDGYIFLKGRIFDHRPLLKDPFAIFSIPWFIQRLNCQIVVTIRHPAAFASSLKRLSWPFDFGDLLSQPLLMRDCLEPYRAEMEAIQKNSGDVIEQSSLLWRIIYQTIADYRLRFPNLQIVRHEDLSLQPLDGYRALYMCLHLEFNKKVERAILSSSSSENPGEVSKSAVHSYRLDSRANLHNWKRRLESNEIKRIRYLTEEVAAGYYSAQDWE